MDPFVELVPSIGVGILFFFVIRAIVQADRRERAAVRRLEEQADRAAGGDTAGHS
ncbi:hypothetical protein [Georgenia faecalis]|uniref:Lysyl-tRNA synthetase n=1 Tax=Georgenia faecalis TaxID=2483799 RepID=A0ABV9D600_9MICO|nr:hypothetical protein [Georgenia faecalis]